VWVVFCFTFSHSIWALGCDPWMDQQVWCGQRTWDVWYGWCVWVVAGQYVCEPVHLKCSPQFVICNADTTDKMHRYRTATSKLRFSWTVAASHHYHNHCRRQFRKLTPNRTERLTSSTNNCHSLDQIIKSRHTFHTWYYTQTTNQTHTKKGKYMYTTFQKTNSSESAVDCECNKGNDWC